MAADTPTLLKKLCRDAGQLTMDQVLQAQELGDEAVSQVIEDAIEYLGIALANTINLISPRAVVCNIADFPYTLIWSQPGMPKFVCIEPWHSLPSAEGSSIKWEEKPAAAILDPGEAWSCTLSTSFVR